MDFFLYMFENTVKSFISRVPLLVTFLWLKIFKLPPKPIAICLTLNLLVSIFCWVKLKDVYLALYQSVPYVSSFIWLWAENVLIKRQEKTNPLGLKPGDFWEDSVPI